MTDDKISFALHDNDLSDKIDSVIEAFVLFYGEEKREEITGKFKNMIFLKVTNPDRIQSVVHSIEQSIVRDVFNIPASKYITISLRNVVNALKDPESKHLSLIKSTTKELFNLNEDGDIILQRYRNGEFPILDKLIEKYEEYKTTLDSLEEQYRIAIKAEKDFNEERYMKFVKSMKQYIPSHCIDYLKSEIDKLPDNIFKESKSATLIREFFRTYFGDSLNANGHCFDTDSERNLNDPEYSDWKKDSIKRDRIEFLKKNGYVKEDELNESYDYDEYMNNPKVQEFIKEITPICDMISRKEREAYNQQEIDRITGLADYKKCRAFIDSYNLYDKNDGLKLSMYASPISCFSGNFIKDGVLFDAQNMILINGNPSSIDQTIIHEFNHAYEYHVFSVDDKECKCTCGWDDTSCELSNHMDFSVLKYKGITRGYEFMSEYINEMIASDINKLLHDNGGKIFESEYIKGNCSYLQLNFILYQFYEHFKKDIIISRSKGNIEHIYNVVGKENFEALNDLCNQYFEAFGMGMNGGFAKIDYNEGKDTPGAKKIAEIMEKRDEILGNMNEYNYNNSLAQ